MTELELDPLVSYSQHDITPGHCCPILWDLREPPECARHVERLEDPLPNDDLNKLATSPPPILLHIICDVFPEPWAIEVRRLTGVTIVDVLQAIYTTLNRRISEEEWLRLSDKQRDRITVVFEARCKLAPDRDACRQDGVFRVDCLMYHTWFAGLSISPDADSTCILTLRRPK